MLRLSSSVPFALIRLLQDITEVKPKMTMLLTAAAMAYDQGFRDIPAEVRAPIELTLRPHRIFIYFFAVGVAGFCATPAGKPRLRLYGCVRRVCACGRVCFVCVDARGRRVQCLWCLAWVRPVRALARQRLLLSAASAFNM
jgi:hypothetical protein